MGNGFLISGIADECADSIDDQIRMHQQLGWSFIEIRNVDGTTIDTMADAVFDGLRETLQANNMRVSCLASDVGKLFLDGERYRDFEEDLTSLERLCRRANALGCEFIRVMGYRRESLSENEWRSEEIRRLRELAHIAKDFGVYLALENCSGWHAATGERVVEVLERVNSPHLVCLFDTGNPGRDGNDTWTYYQAVRDRIAYIHVKDKAGTSAGMDFAFPGEGSSRVLDILKDQYALGYRGFVSVEPHIAKSAHLPQLGGDPWTSYGEYGRRFNALLEKICS